MLSDGDKLTIGRVLFVVNAEASDPAAVLDDLDVLTFYDGQVFEDERVGRLLAADRRFRAVARIDDRLVREREQHFR